MSIQHRSSLVRYGVAVFRLFLWTGLLVCCWMALYSRACRDFPGPLLRRGVADLAPLIAVPIATLIAGTVLPRLSPLACLVALPATFAREPAHSQMLVAGGVEVVAPDTAGLLAHLLAAGLLVNAVASTRSNATRWIIAVFGHALWIAVLRHVHPHYFQWWEHGAGTMPILDIKTYATIPGCILSLAAVPPRDWVRHLVGERGEVPTASRPDVVCARTEAQASQYPPLSTTSMHDRPGDALEPSPAPQETPVQPEAVRDGSV